MPRGSNFKRPYPPEFRREAVELYRRSGRPLKRPVLHGVKALGRTMSGRSVLLIRPTQLDRTLYVLRPRQDSPQRHSLRAGPRRAPFLRERVTSERVPVEPRPLLLIVS